MNATTQAPRETLPPAETLTATETHALLVLFSGHDDDYAAELLRRVERQRKQSES